MKTTKTLSLVSLLSTSHKAREDFQQVRDYYNDHLCNPVVSLPGGESLLEIKGITPTLREAWGNTEARHGSRLEIEEANYHNGLEFGEAAQEEGFEAVILPTLKSGYGEWPEPTIHLGLYDSGLTTLWFKLDMERFSGPFTPPEKLYVLKPFEPEVGVATDGTEFLDPDVVEVLKKERVQGAQTAAESEKWPGPENSIFSEDEWGYGSKYSAEHLQTKARFALRELKRKADNPSGVVVLLKVGPGSRYKRNGAEKVAYNLLHNALSRGKELIGIQPAAGFRGGHPGKTGLNKHMDWYVLVIDEGLKEVRGDKLLEHLREHSNYTLTRFPDR